MNGQNILIKLYIPTTEYNEVINSIDLKIRFGQSQTLFDSLFGGSTLFDSSPVKGSYVSEDGTIIREDLYLIESQVSEDRFKELEKEFEKGIQILKEIWIQESLTVKFTRSEEYRFY